MLEYVTDGDEHRKHENRESLDAVTMLLVKAGSRRGLRLRVLRLVGATLSSIASTREFPSATSTSIRHDSPLLDERRGWRTADWERYYDVT